MRSEKERRNMELKKKRERDEMRSEKQRRTMEFKEEERERRNEIR